MSSPTDSRPESKSCLVNDVTSYNRIAELAEPLIRYLNALYKQQHAPAPEETMQAVPRRFFI